MLDEACTILDVPSGRRLGRDALFAPATGAVGVHPRSQQPPRRVLSTDTARCTRNFRGRRRHRRPTQLSGGPEKGVCPIPKATGDVHLHENRATNDVLLDQETVERIDNIDRSHRVVDLGRTPELVSGRTEPRRRGQSLVSHDRHGNVRIEDYLLGGVAENGLPGRRSPPAGDEHVVAVLLPYCREHDIGRVADLA